MKFLETAIVLAEIPDQITLAINITGCGIHCEGCHSPYLSQDIGEELTFDRLVELIEDNPDITCVSFMGGDSDTPNLYKLATKIKEKYKDLKLGWYSGRDYLWNWELFKVFDYIKIGHYDKDLGPLNSKTTNQRMYRKHLDGKVEDITYRFWH